MDETRVIIPQTPTDTFDNPEQARAELEKTFAYINLSALVKGLNGFYLLEIEDRGISENLHRDVAKFVDSGKYELLMEAKEDGETIHIYTCGKGDKISSFVLLVGEKDQCTFICLDGEISRKQLEAMISGEK